MPCTVGGHVLPRRARSALSSFDPYVSFTGRITGYAVVNLRRGDEAHWHVAPTNVWKVERVLLDLSSPPKYASPARG